MDHLEPIRQKVRAAQVGKLPAAWFAKACVTVGGLIEVGFADESDLLLVHSHQGRGIIDCITGQKIARDYSIEGAEADSWYCTQSLIAQGFGPLKGKKIRLAGLFGGGLSTCSKTGWTVERLPIDWPDECLLLLEPHCSIYQSDARFVKLAVESEVRAFGFSDTGMSLIIATSSEVTIFART